jgi:hypothetical protein
MIGAMEKYGARALWSGFLVGLALLIFGTAPARAESTMVRIPTQYIAALGDPFTSSGNDAHTWGLWELDPGPRGVWISNYDGLVANDGIAPAGWQYQEEAWWLEEHGLIMEAPSFPLPPGEYVVTGGRMAIAVLTVEAPDADGSQAWSLSDDAMIYDVTHLGCRAAFYTSIDGAQACNPQSTPTEVFPMVPGRVMPEVEGCNKQDYQVLIVVGMMVDEG